MSKSTALATRVLAPATGLLLFLQAALVVTGGAVRLTGSGLGCPTWPECTPGSYTPVPHQAEPQLNVWIEFANRLLTFVLVIASIAVIIAVLKSKRKDLRGLAIGQFLGIFGQGVLGGITVLTDLNPIPVAGHLLLSIILIAGATSLHSRRYTPVEFVKPTSLTSKISITHIVTSFLVIVLGTIVTGSGPHAGDAQAKRFGFDIRTVAWLHADIVIFLLGVTFAFYVAQGTSAHSKRAIKIFAVIALAQGGIGYVQYFTGVPEILVGAHLLGATLVWIAAWRIRLSVITQNG
jgi:cytochrome c oxidase assembly protein subunit 15